MIETGDENHRTVLERLKSDGYLAISIPANHQGLIRVSFDIASRFFHLPMDEKNANGLPEECGYRPFGIEYSQSSTRPDSIESFTASVRSRIAAENLPSVDAYALHEALLVAIDALEPLAEELVVELATAISGRPQDRLCGAMHRWSCIQVNYARPADGAQEFINELHEDGHLITLACATAPGLELMVAGSAVLPAAATTEQLLVMPGEIASFLSGAEIQPLHHRVRRNPSSQERLSLLFFCDLDPVLCEPWLRNETNAGVDVGMHVLRNATRFGLRGFSKE